MSQKTANSGKVEIDSEKIAEIRNALQVILGETEQIHRKVGYYTNGVLKEQVKRIDKLLPQVELKERENESRRS